MDTITFKGYYVAGNVKTFDFESYSLFSFAFQLTLQNPNVTKQERKAKPFLEVQSSKLKAQSPNSSKKRQMKSVVFFYYGFIWKIKIGMKVFHHGASNWGLV